MLLTVEQLTGVPSLSKTLFVSRNVTMTEAPIITYNHRLTSFELNIMPLTAQYQVIVIFILKQTQLTIMIVVFNNIDLTLTTRLLLSVLSCKIVR